MEQRRRKLEYKNYCIYFTSECLVEPFHAHINSPKAVKSGAAKIWLNPYNKTYKIADCGKFTIRELSDVCNNYLLQNVTYLMNEWLHRNDGILTLYVDLRQ